jgi:IMP dehydrogenase/GMP reductase
MRIDLDIKLDFSDVLLLPKRSDMSSRSEALIEREIKFKHSSYVWKGVPIIVSNMDTTGTIEMARKLQEFKVITCLHKYYTADDIPNDLDPDYFMISTGITDSDLERLDNIVTKKKINFICVDVANGYSINFQNKVKKIKEKYPDKVIVAGNVVTKELVEELIMHCGVDIVKVGIGSGCFSSDTKILMSDLSQKNICDIKVGDKVLNMNGKPVSVTNVLNQGMKETVVLTQKKPLNNTLIVNHTICTPDHRFWIFDRETNNFEWCELENMTKNMRFTYLESISNEYVYSDESNFYFKNNGLEEVFDITVDDVTHSFIANGNIVHNSVCTTRLQTGIGYPQFSAVMECADAAHGLNGHIISDGGIQNVGDFSKALGGGADFVMCGSMFAGHTESGGELIEEGDKKYKVFYGMSSSNAMNKYHGGVAHYRSAEGKCVKILYKGDVEQTILNILGGIRSSMTYIGAHNLKDIPKCSSFIRVNNIVNKIYSNDMNH